MFDELLRYLVLLTFRILLHVFFNDVEVLGAGNIPKKGAVIFVGEHRTLPPQITIHVVQIFFFFC